MNPRGTTHHLAVIVAAIGTFVAPATLSAQDCGQVYFEDGFEAYASDADVIAAGWQLVDTNTPAENATWTITNPGNRSHPATRDGSPSTGNFMASDSDAASGSNPTGSGMSHDMITPSFSTLGSNRVWLHAACSAVLNNNGEAIFDIDVSVDAGASWTNVFRRIAPGRSQEPLPSNTNADGFFGQLDVNLSSAAANQADVRVRFRHFEPNDDWFILLDDVVVDCNASPSGGGCVVFEEDFADGLGGMTAVSAAAPPNSGTETWHTSDKGNRYTADAVGQRGVNRLTHPDATPNFAILDSDANPDPAEDEFLMTPAFDFTDYAEVFLHWKSETVLNGDDAQEVLISLDGGATFEAAPIFDYLGGGAFHRGEDPVYAERVFAVPTAVGQSNVAFAFRWAGGDDWWWAVDDIKVTGTVPGCVSTYFADDFEAYETDGDMAAAGWQAVDVNGAVETATWTITNPGDRANPATVNGAPSTGKFMASDSDAASGSNPTGSGMSHDLITPRFSTAGGDVVWLHVACSAVLNDNGECIFDIDATTDDGASWTNVFRRIAPGRSAEPLADNSNADGFFGQIDVDLGAFANQPEVRLRFRHFEPNDDWFILLDDLAVDVFPPPQGGDCEVFSEDFSAGLGAMTARSGTGNTGTETWHTTDKGGRYAAGTVSGRGVNRLNHPEAAPNFAILDSDTDPDPAEDEFLITPAFNLENFDEVFLHYKSETVLNADDAQEVLLSLDGGATFEPEPLFDYLSGAAFDRGEDPVYAERILAVPAAAGQPNVAFAFHWAGGDDWWWAVDDIKVSGATDNCDLRDCGLRGFSVAFDPATNTVEGSWMNLLGDEGFQVLQGERVVAANLPADASSFTDSTPTPGGTDIVYTLQPLVGGGVERDCLSNAINTYIAPAGFVCRPDHGDKTVAVSWTPGVNLDATGVELRRNGELIASLGLGDSAFGDTIVPGEEKALVPLNYELVTAGGGQNLTVACGAVLSTGEVCFSDDFEDYETDLELEFAEWFPVDANDPLENATWTVTNPGGRSNPPTFNGQPSAGSRFAISDSDAAGSANTPGSGMSHDLWSPIIEPCSDTVWLHMDVSAQMNNNGVSVFDVDVSTDGGLNWANVFRRVAPCRLAVGACEAFPGAVEPAATHQNADGFFGRLDVDLTSAIGPANNFRFRVRHFEPNDDWWIAVDNVIVDDVPPLTGGEETVFEEDFSAGLGAMTAISVVDPPNMGTETWHTTDKAGRHTIGLVGERRVNRIEQSATNITNFVARIDGGQEAPDPVDTAATGRGTFTYDGETRELSFDIEFSGLSSPENNAHIHTAPSGQPGAVIHGLPAGSPKVGSVALSEAEATDLFAGNLYVNIHSENFPAGEIRGQILQTGFAILESDANPDPVEDEFLLTPALDLGAFERVFLHVESETVVSGDTQDILLSLDGGATYEARPVFSYTSGAMVDTGEDPFYARLVLEVPGAAGQDDVVFAFHWAAGGNEWWWAVDNVRVTGTVPTPVGGGQLPGDPNQDDTVDISDVIRLLEHLFLLKPATLPCGNGSVNDPANRALADFNGDGVIDISDAIAALGWQFLGGRGHVLGLGCVRIIDCPDRCSP